VRCVGCPAAVAGILVAVLVRIVSPASISPIWTIPGLTATGLSGFLCQEIERG